MVKMINIGDIHVSETEERRCRTNSALMQELVDSIHESGMLFPVTVSREQERYVIISGLRRYIAAKRAGLKQIPALIAKSWIDICRCDITSVHADAIVNPTNERLWADAGVSKVIFQSAGLEELTKECEKVGKCETGSAVITSGFRLAKYIIHAVGPMWDGGNANELSVLRNTYRKVFELAREHGCHSIAVPLWCWDTWNS